MTQPDKYHIKNCNSQRGPQYPCDCPTPKKTKTDSIMSAEEFSSYIFDEYLVSVPHVAAGFRLGKAMEAVKARDEAIRNAALEEAANQLCDNYPGNGMQNIRERKILVGELRNMKTPSKETA